MNIPSLWTVLKWDYVDMKTADDVAKDYVSRRNFLNGKRKFAH